MCCAIRYGMRDQLEWRIKNSARELSGKTLAIGSVGNQYLRITKQDSRGFEIGNF
jgi:hypothetical protein